MIDWRASRGLYKKVNEILLKLDQKVFKIEQILILDQILYARRRVFFSVPETSWA